MSRELVEEPRGWVCRRERPGPGWLGHGYTRKRLILLAENQLASVVVHKQRWRNPTTGQTVHDRPLRDVAWAHYGLAVVFAASWTWMTAPRGLHHVEWAWPEARPSLRTVQRWMARLLADALAWQVAIRVLISDHLAPTPLEERFPAGLPPPGGVARWRSSVPQARQLSVGLALLYECAPLLSIPPPALVVEARRKFLDALQP